ncbi:hypothetical protein K3G63_03330 [Hymenobacter sp. HSC-4F20]|uniref:hypothetical protein n=1 Tax=Hymenobacter sp. HSC-4F20 TaxID=2864135 RepID=UPI001C73C902|nr:hypothetical protein [Hymenobacter sp. HSC-4F20]MBX0289451.1 hypothetical protein [Hymenobacter sp. HSC-4F20]
MSWPYSWRLLPFSPGFAPCPYQIGATEAYEVIMSTHLHRVPCSTHVKNIR